MLRSLGLLGGLGLLMVLGGIGLIAYVDPLLAAAMFAILVGLVLVVKDLVGGMLASFGMGGF